MSFIKIVCKKGVTTNENNKQDIENQLIIEANQLFMNTKEFFEKIEETLKNYFNSVEVKK